MSTQLPAARVNRSAFSMIGMLITMVCMLVLFVILMNSLNKAVTGQKTQQEGTVRSFEDKMYLSGFFQSMLVNANVNKGEYLTPSRVARSDDPAWNTTANFYSAMVMEIATPGYCRQLISGNEYSGYVQEKADYDYTTYDPAQGVFWDQSFVADLKNLSNVSFAHVPLYGDRWKKNWRSTMDSTFPLVGNRGPEAGVNSSNSYACGRDGVWRGHIVFGDGHVDFIETPTPNGLTFVEDGRPVQDNIFSMEDGSDGADAVLSFTKTMTKDGPQLQFD